MQTKYTATHIHTVKHQKDDGNTKAHNKAWVSACIYACMYGRYRKIFNDY